MANKYESLNFFKLHLQSKDNNRITLIEYITKYMDYATIIGIDKSYYLNLLAEIRSQYCYG